MDFTGLIKSTKRVDVYILVAIDRFSKWPTAQVCKNTDTRTVLKVLTKYFTDNGTPRCIKTDSGSCFKSNEFKKFGSNENIKRIRCTPNLHTGTGLVERTIRTIESSTRANMADGIIFEDSVQLAIETTRQTPHSRLNMTPFQMHLGRKPRTSLINLIGKPEVYYLTGSEHQPIIFQHNRRNCRYSQSTIQRARWWTTWYSTIPVLRKRKQT